MTEKEKRVRELLDAVVSGDQEARNELKRMEQQAPDEMRHIYTRIRLTMPITFETVGHKKLARKKYDSPTQ